MAILKTGKMIGVCIHHSAVRPGAENKSELKKRASSYNTTHSKKSWAEETKTKGEFGYPYIEYHYMIAKDGYLLQVQDEKYVLYHAGDVFRGASSFNLHGIAIMLDGNYEEETPTDAQMLTLVKLIRDIQTRYKIDALVRGHKETSQTATSCPGKNIGISSSGWLKKVIKNVNDKNYPPVVVVPPVEPPQPPQPTEQEKQVITLKEQIVVLESTITSLMGDLKSMSAELAQQKKEYSELEKSYGVVIEERDRFEKEKNEAISIIKVGLDGVRTGELIAEIWRRILSLK